MNTHASLRHLLGRREIVEIVQSQCWILCCTYNCSDMCYHQMVGASTVEMWDVEQNWYSHFSHRQWDRGHHIEGFHLGPTIEKRRYLDQSYCNLGEDRPYLASQCCRSHSWEGDIYNTRAEGWSDLDHHDPNWVLVIWGWALYACASCIYATYSQQKSSIWCCIVWNHAHERYYPSSPYDVICIKGRSKTKWQIMCFFMDVVSFLNMTESILISSSSVWS